MEYQRTDTLRGRVEYCLDKFVDTRDDDVYLLAEVLSNFYPLPEKPIIDWREYVSVLNHIPSLDSIAKARREAIELKMYQKWLPNSYEVAEKRKIDRRLWVKYARKNDLPINEAEYKSRLQASILSQASNIPEGYNQDGEIDTQYISTREIS